MITIPEFDRSPYPIFLFSSLLLGVGLSCLFMKREKMNTGHIFLVAFLNIICTFLVSTIFAGSNYFKPQTIGFDGLGGAAGLIGGTITSCFIFKDRWKSILSSCIVPAPFMYSIAKIGCFLAGCCRGFEYDGILSVVYKGESFFPAQLLDIIVFMLVFIVSVIVMVKVKDGTTVALFVVIASGIARFLTDFARLSHEGKVLSLRQIVILFAIGIAIIFYVLCNNKNKERDR